MSTPPQNLFDRNNKLIGMVKTSGSWRQLFSRNAKLLGWYDIKTDITYDRNGKLIGHGDLTFTLIEDQLKV